MKNWRIPRISAENSRPELEDCNQDNGQSPGNAGALSIPLPKSLSASGLHRQEPTANLVYRLQPHSRRRNTVNGRMMRQNSDCLKSPRSTSAMLQMKVTTGRTHRPADYGVIYMVAEIGGL